MKHRITVAVTILALIVAQASTSARPHKVHKKTANHHKTARRGIHPPPGFHAYRATMYGNERSARARRISRRLPASGIPFRDHGHTFAMNGALNKKFAIWTPGHGITVASCTDTGADHPDLANGFFREIYYQEPSRERKSATEAGVMTIWMKRLPGHVNSPLWRAHHRRNEG